MLYEMITTHLLPVTQRMRHFASAGRHQVLALLTHTPVPASVSNFETDSGQKIVISDRCAAKVRFEDAEFSLRVHNG
jgi:hypothetical protein